MRLGADRFPKRIESLRQRIETLSSLRRLASLPPEHDIGERQWAAIEPPLVASQERLLSRLKRGAREYLRSPGDRGASRRLNAFMGEIELEMTRAFTFFDTYMDVLTQRNTPELGPLLAGCDVLAWDAIHRDHPALAIVEPPLVYCDRGFGASILREGILLPDGTPNPAPLIQIPYTRLSKEKYNLTSVLHEVGHEAMVRLGLASALPKAFRAALARAGASDILQDLFALWSAEIGPDFWTFCAAGMAQAAGLRDILSLPPSHVFRVSSTDPHPPPYLRVLLSFEWCRQVWGGGDWEEWQKEWLELYPLDPVPEAERSLLRKAKSFLPVLARMLLTAKFKALGRRRIPDLFEVAKLAPTELDQRARSAKQGVLNLKGLSPTIQLAVFRLIKDRANLNEDALDRIMTSWLQKLGAGK